MDRKRFHRLAEAAFRALPAVLLDRADNVVVWIEDRPPADVLAELGLDHPDDLLGLYEGLPLAERGIDTYGVLPDRVVLYQRPIERYARDEAVPVADVIWDTLLHELGHHLGFDDDQLERLERSGEPPAG